jgi:hypothetical protein
MQANTFDNGKLLLDVLPRFALGFKISIEMVRLCIHRFTRLYNISNVPLIYCKTHIRGLFRYIIKGKATLPSTFSRAFDTHFKRSCNTIKMRQLIFQKFFGGTLRKINRCSSLCRCYS